MGCDCDQWKWQYGGRDQTASLVRVKIFSTMGSAVNAVGGLVTRAPAEDIRTFCMTAHSLRRRRGLTPFIGVDLVPRTRTV